MKLKIMTWNVENLFRPGEDGPSTQDVYEAKLKALADAIDQLSPDVLALQEVGSKDSFNDLNGKLHYPYAALSNKPDSRGIRVGFLSKIPLDSPEDIVDFTPNPCLALADENGEPVKAMRRGALWVRTTVDGLKLNLVTAHLKSKLLSYPKPGGGTAFSTNDENLRARVASLALGERTAEAVTLRTRVTQILQGNDSDAVILLGDLNDVPEAATTQILQGPEGSQPETGGFDRPDNGDAMRLFNLGWLVPKEKRYSRVNNGVPEMIDHIFASNELLPLDEQTKKRIVPVVESHPDLQGHIESVGTDPHKRKDKPASDHAPVTAVFDF